MVQQGPLSTATAFPAIFGFRIGGGLPLHILRRIGAVARQGDDMIDHPAGASPSGTARRGTGLLALKGSDRGMAPTGSGVCARREDEERKQRED